MVRAERRIFIYGSLLEGERDHPLLRGAPCIERLATEARFHLVDLGAYAAIVDGGATAVVGELYVVTVATLAAIDVARQVPLLFQRTVLALAGGLEADAYVMGSDQVRGRRRLHGGDWRRRFAPTAPDPTRDRPWSQWARGRSSDRS